MTMPFDFLHQHRARRLRQYLEQPPLELPETDAAEQADEPEVCLDLEYDVEDWRPIPLAGPIDPDVLPRRFIDGCHRGETVAWLQAPQGYPIPVRLAEIGGVCMRLDGRTLRREFAVVERVVSLIVDPFPWNEIEDFAGTLIDHGMRLLPALPPELSREGGVRGLTYDFARMQEQPRFQTQHEMSVLEELTLCQDLEVPSLVDGRLGRFQQSGLARQSIIGVIKQQRESYLHAQGWRTLYQLEPGQRTPAFRVPSKHLPVVSWYLKLDGAHGAMPNWGVVRVEVAWEHFVKHAPEEFGYVDRLSRALVHLRCRQGSYARAAVSLEPIVRAEESLKSLLSNPLTLMQRFYHLAGL
jgi:hypothetical protein